MSCNSNCLKFYKSKIKDFTLDKDVDTAELAKKMFDKKLTGADITKVATKSWKIKFNLDKGFAGSFIIS